MSVILRGRFSSNLNVRIRLKNVLPKIVTGISSSLITSSSFTLSFVRELGVTYQYTFNNGATWLNLPLDGSITGLISQTSYSVRVRGVNRYGVGLISAATVVTTLSAFASFDPARLGSGVTLSNSNTTVTMPGSWKSALCTRPKFPGTGRYYLEFQGGTNVRIGIVDGSVNLETEILSQGYPCIYPYGGILYNKGSNQETSTEGSIIANPPQVYGMLWDSYSRKITFTRDGRILFVHSTSDQISGSPIYAAVSAISDSITLNFGPTFKYLPSGYTAW